MLIEAQQRFSLTYPGPPEAALAFLRDPARSLRAVRFLRGVTFDGAVVRAELLVAVPMLGELAVPFESVVEAREEGAVLVPRPLTGRAWAEVAGGGRAAPDGAVSSASRLDYAFSFRVHVQVPTAERWGGAAFEKMAQASARRTLERVAHEFPRGVQAAMP